MSRSGCILERVDGRDGVLDCLSLGGRESGERVENGVSLGGVCL